MQYKFLKGIMVVLVFITSFTFGGCSAEELQFEKIANHTNVVEDSAYGKIKMTFDILDGEDVRAFETKPGKTFSFIYDYDIDQGDIKIAFTDSNGEILGQTEWSSEFENRIQESEGESAKLNGSGGVLSIKSTDNKLRIVIMGKVASGNLVIEW